MICSITCGGPEVTMVIRLSAWSSRDVGHGQALDIVAARGEQPGDPARMPASLSTMTESVWRSAALGA